MKSGFFGRPNPTAKTAAPSCSHETLARSNVLHVQRCTHCNTLSLHFGPLTVRFDAESVESIWNTLGEALIVLHSGRQEAGEQRGEQRASLRGPAYEDPNRGLRSGKKN
jgi:hypothetical protein